MMIGRRSPMHYKEFPHKVIINWPRAPEFPTADPNDAYREWLEEKAGKQMVGWDWRMDSIRNIEISFLDINVAIEFKFRWTTVST